MERMRNKIRKWLFIVGSMFIGMVFTGCSKESEGQIEITFFNGWGSTDEDHLTMRDIYSDFEKENPDISINMISLPTTAEAIRKVEDMLMIGEVPDIVFLGGNGVDTIYQYMVNHNLTLDIMPYLEEDSEFMSEISPKNLEYWTTQNHHLYTVSDVLMLGGGYWYNVDIFQQAGIDDLPQTWGEFETVCEKIQVWAEEQNNNVEALHLTAESYLYCVDQIMAIHQTPILDNYLVINQTELYDVLDILENIYAYTSFTETEEYTYRDETDLFNDGKLAIYINGVWGASMIVDEINAKYALLPGEGTTISCESAGLGYVLGKTGNTGKEEASVRFLKYMLSEEVQSRILRETQQVPANPNVDIREYQEEMPRLCQAIETAKSAAIKIEVPNQLWSVQRREVFEEHIFDVLSQTLLRQTFYDLLK